jgi:GAF domain-containing protein
MMVLEQLRNEAAMISTLRLTEAFVEVADTLVADFDLVDFLHDLTDHAAAISGADAVGLVLADQGGQLQFMAASNDSGKALELFQLQAEQGPCRDCFLTQEPVVNADLGSAEAPWPTFAPRARAAGFQSVHAFPMRLRAEAIGALNLFSTRRLRFDAEDVRVVQALADVATIAILQQRVIARAEALTEQLQGALNSRVLIEQAKGAVAQRDGITPEQAFVKLRGRARSERRRLLDVAAEALQRD